MLTIKNNKMETKATATKITVETTVNAPIEKVWQNWTDPVILYVGIMLPRIGAPLRQKMTCGKAAPLVLQWPPRMGV